jgi:glycosyltransferase involved in cell wall biosynthesis
MEQGLPIVATPVGGVPRIVLDGGNGILIDVDNPEQLAAAILRLELDPTLRARLGATGRQIAVHHTPPQMAQSYLELYLSILQPKSL